MYQAEDIGQTFVVYVCSLKRVIQQTRGVNGRAEGCKDEGKQAVQAYELSITTIKKAKISYFEIIILLFVNNPWSESFYVSLHKYSITTCPNNEYARWTFEFQSDYENLLDSYRVGSC